MGNYQAICDTLCSTLRLTRQFDDLVKLEHIQEGKERYVVAKFDSYYTKRIRVTMDSGIAMIKDIVNHL